ncbi:uncharacterized protein LOC134269802 [Saccostrea cucullata]|uniref:uncharacterized protein LOC134269802 n=1 Tax=Saccostrea cuccullata TaxID=36930 RepID=UPI002ED4ECBE
MTILILIISFWSTCQGRSYWRLSVGNMVDEATVTIRWSCTYFIDKKLFNHRDSVPVMFAQIRKSSTWRNIVMLNNTGYYLLNTDPIERNNSTSDGVCENRTDNYHHECSLRIISTFKMNGCSIDPDLFFVYRCQFSNGSGIFTSFENESVGKGGLRVYDIDFRQGSIELQTNNENPFSEGDVVQLQFSGNIRRVPAFTKGVKCCKKKFGKFKPISLQDSPIMTLVPSGQNGCNQHSLIFYHITQNDTELEIMCDAEDRIRTTRCSETSDSPKILINTSIKTKGKW